jgi:hypothetical protein
MEVIPSEYLLAREVELHSYFASMVATDLAETREDPGALDEQLALLRSFASTALKTSRLLWKRGNRITDLIGGEEAERLRTRAGVRDSSPLSPDQVESLAPLLRLSRLQLAEAWEPRDCSLALAEGPLPIEPFMREMHHIHRRVKEINEAHPALFSATAGRLAS